MLVHLTDREQNMHISDRYFHGIPLNVSNALLVFSYNNVQDIPPVLLDRLNIIKLNVPSTAEKINIAKEHLIPRALSTMGFPAENISFPETVIEHIIENYTEECGVRGLEKAIHRIIGTLVVLVNVPDGLRSISIEKTVIEKVPIVCTCEVVDNILNTHKQQKSTSHLMMYN